MDGAVVESNCIIAAGAVVTQGTRVPEGSIFGGLPAKKIRDTPEELKSGEIDRIANAYVTYAGWFRDEG
jgi:carbonic anhydrase/acetyltransferase-like protein (isoleucine patch superfamily)